MLIVTEAEMRKLMNVLILSTMLFVFVQPAKQPRKARTGNDHHRYHSRTQRSNAITQAEAIESGW